jgi:SNF2 family DNA or RNA helicase
MDDSTTSEDDPEITWVVERGAKVNTNGNGGHGGDSEDEAEEEKAQRPSGRMRDAHKKGERITWSDDEGETVYEKFKSRVSRKRKRGAASTRKAKAIEAEGSKGKRAQTVKNGKISNGKGGRDYGDASDDDPDEDSLPDYLQARRALFDKRTTTLKAAGLKLPPSYDDVNFSDDERLKHLQERPYFPKATPSSPYKDIHLPYSLGLIPAPIAQWLRDYQVQGVSFLHKLFVYQDGGILGDDMGLGKTVQVIAFLTASFGKTGDERDAKRMRKMRRGSASWYPRALVVCPGTLIENWKAEFQRWGWWHVDVYHGDTKEAAIKSAAAGRLEIMITTYTTYRMNKDEINMIDWDCVIADECHQIKGRRSETTQAMNDINALCRIGLTGTAIQNSYDELWTLLNWTNPGKFGPISVWKHTISDPLRLGQSHDATVAQLSKARKTAKALVENLLPNFFLRRMKTLIAHQLPKKSDRVVFCPLTDTQADAYENMLDGDVISYIKNSSESCECGSGNKSGWCCNARLPNGDKWQSHVFPAIANLQKLSNHLGILIPQGTDPKDKQDRDLETLQVAVPDQWRELYRNRDSILNYSNPEFCGKWKILKKLLRFWHGNGDKVLVFSHSVRLLKMLQMLFNHTAYNVSYLDGAMSYEDRAKTVDDFNSDPAQFVFLISTKAGGVGLNITSANKVVIVDPNWNPAYDLQAQDRAYRIGQVRDVEVFRLVSAGTIEEIVYARQIYKQQQANIGYTASTERRYFKGVQENKHQKGEIFGLANLFAYQGDNIVLRDIVNKTNVAESKVGVAVVGFNLEDSLADAEDDPLLAGGDDEDSAMSQLAALVVQNAEEAADTKKARKITSTKRTDPVQAILAGAGVEYTHENSEVVGSSKVEAHLSRKAEQAGNDIEAARRHVFVATQEQDVDYAQSDQDAIGDEDEKAVRWRYHPPEDVIKRQFCTMAKTFNFSDAVEFALVVESWTQEQRRNCLDRFYRIRREARTVDRGRPSPEQTA